MSSEYEHSHINHKRALPLLFTVILFVTHRSSMHYYRRKGVPAIHLVIFIKPYGAPKV
jgi:hypothetical protein